MGIRIDAHEEVPVERPQFSEAQAKAGENITQTDLGAPLGGGLERYGGSVSIGEGDDLIRLFPEPPRAALRRRFDQGYQSVRPGGWEWGANSPDRVRIPD